MKLRIFSDTHLDHYRIEINQDLNLNDQGLPRFWYPVEMPDDKETTLILAGDLWIGTRFIEYGTFSWIGEMSKRFKQVLVVLGNHDFWDDITIKNGAQKCNDMLQDMCLFNVKVLDCDTFEDDGILFIGATLWTDMYKMDPIRMYDMTRCMHYDGKIKYDTGPNGYMERFTSQKWIDTHIRHRDYIRLIANQNRDNKIVVITHHQPLMTLGDPCYANDAATAYYVSDLSDLILDNENIKLWVCGHSHVANDLMFDHCRMYMNPVGYQGEMREMYNFVKHEVIEI